MNVSKPQRQIGRRVVLLLPLVLIASPLLTQTVGQRQTSSLGADLVQNGGFEEGGTPPSGWSRDMKSTGDKGVAGQDRSRAHSGMYSLQLKPNSRNGGSSPLSMNQIFPGASFRGQKIEISGYLSAEGGAKAILGMLSVVQGRPGNLAMAVPVTSGDWTLRRLEYDVPDDPSVQLVLSCWVDGQSGTAWFDDIAVGLPGSGGERSSAGPPIQPPAAAGPQQALKAAVEVDTGNIVRQIPPTLYGTNVEWRWNANSLWQEASERPSPEVERLTHELGVTLIRYPGGIYSDFYHWKQGIGPYQKRPEVIHEQGSNDRSRPNFGTEEALAFAHQVGAELLITVNAGTGTPEEAADWVRFVNEKELRVRYWEVGNEIYSRDAPGKHISTDPATYAKRFLQFARAMRAADSRIEIGAIGGENHGRYDFIGYPDWNRVVLQAAGSEIDFLSVHNAYAPVLAADQDKDLRTVYEAMLAAPVLVSENLKRLSQEIAQYAPARASKIFIAVTEWGPFFQLDFNSRYVDHNKTLGSALFAASDLKAILESPQTQIACFWFLNDVSVLGWIGSRSTVFPPQPDWTPTANYYAFELYTHHFGAQLVRSRASGPAFDSQAIGWVDAVRQVPYLDVVASLSSDGRQLYIIAINKNFDSPISTTVQLDGFRPGPDATAWTLSGTGIDANTGTQVIHVPGLKVAHQVEDTQNPRFYKGGPNEVTLTSAQVGGIGTSFTYVFPARSVTSLALMRAGK